VSDLPAEPADPGSIFVIKYYGGPHDGREMLSGRPYDRMTEPDGCIYESPHEGVAALEPPSPDDGSGIRKTEIHLFYKGKKGDDERGDA
jgi:hypothetical protein